jgi:hydrogenase expression/formation protein HypE
MKSSDIILLDHGSGGQMSHDLVSDLFLPLFDNPILSEMHDGAILNIQGKKLAFSTDTYTVDPIFFPGGNIGDLAVNGTVNDVSMCGATPLYISLGLIIEEGFSISDLKKILETISYAAKKAGVKIVTGDTKVVPRGSVDKIFINTSGIGIIPKNINISSSNACVGDKIILSGSIAEHGITILTKKEGMQFETNLKSDTAPLNQMVKNMISVCADIHVLRDPTRGGVGTALNEIARQSHIGVKIYEDKIPIKKETAGVCEFLGLDPLYIANEGRLLAFVPEKYAKIVLEVLKKDESGKNSSIIGEVIAENPDKVVMKTIIGGNRIVDMLTGEQFPRIC